jgi:hypothetical protein
MGFFGGFGHEVGQTGEDGGLSDPHSELTSLDCASGVEAISEMCLDACSGYLW